MTAVQTRYNRAISMVVFFLILICWHSCQINIRKSTILTMTYFMKHRQTEQTRSREMKLQPLTLKMKKKNSSNRRHMQPPPGWGHVHDDLCKHLGIDLSTNHPDWYSNLFLNAYINRHVHAEYLKMI